MLLKRITIILTAVLYLAMSTGMVLSAHYCMGDLADISLGHDTAEKCADCGMDNNGCCHDDVKVFRLTDAHGPSSGMAMIKMVSLPAILPKTLTRVELAAYIPMRKPTHIPDPPEPDGISLCIRHSVFRI
jgi:hypothetical protein